MLDLRDNAREANDVLSTSQHGHPFRSVGSGHYRAVSQAFWAEEIHNGGYRKVVDAELLATITS